MCQGRAGNTCTIMRNDNDRKLVIRNLRLAAIITYTSWLIKVSNDLLLTSSSILKCHSLLRMSLRQKFLLLLLDCLGTCAIFNIPNCQFDKRKTFENRCTRISLFLTVVWHLSSINQAGTAINVIIDPVASNTTTQHHIHQQTSVLQLPLHPNRQFILSNLVIS